MKESYFYTWNRKLDKYASILLRGEQLHYLTGNGIPIDKNLIFKIRNEKIIWIKPLVEDLTLIKFLSLTNDIYLDILDNFEYINIIYSNLKDIERLNFIWPNEFSYRSFAPHFKGKSTVIYHQADRRISENIKQYNNLFNRNLICYYGSPHKMNNNFDIPNLTKILPTKNNLNLDLLSTFNIHYISRDEKYQYDPITKLSTAASIKNTIVLCSKYETYAELLGVDYPYYLENLNDINKDIKINSDKWYKAISIMEKVDEKLNIYNIMNQFNKFLKIK
jgi:hypothetical protein